MALTGNHSFWLLEPGSLIWPNGLFLRLHKRYMKKKGILVAGVCERVSKSVSLVFKKAQKG